MEYHPKAKRTFLSAANRAERCAWAKQMRKRGHDWTTTVCTDEKVFVLQDLQKAAWAPTGQRRYRNSRQFPSSVMVWGGLSVHGSTEISIITGTVDATAYQSILQSTLVPLGKKLSRMGLQWSFQQDNARPHVARSTMAWIAGHPIIPTPIPWPPYSADVSPIENLWALVQADVNSSNPTTMVDLKKAIRDSWRGRTGCADCMGGLLGNWKERVRQLSENGGGTLKY